MLLLRQPPRRPLRIFVPHTGQKCAIDDPRPPRRGAARVPAMKVRVLAAGGTIAMSGEGGAQLALDAPALVAAVSGLQVGDGIESETVVNLPSAHLTLADQLTICRAARDAAREGVGGVVTHGTDTLEETAMLCDVIHDSDAPIVFTGAIRAASAPGADGAADPGEARCGVSGGAGEPAAHKQPHPQRGGEGAGRSSRVRRRDPPRAYGAQDGHHLAHGV